jgi:DHA1 family bicyclomycin/chloramphenicol resistance-like MFS transporter
MILTLLFLMPFASIAAVLFTPSLPLIASSFGVSEAVAGSSITTFLFGYAFGNLPYGPIAKRYGRKTAIWCGLSLTLLGTCTILFSGAFKIWSLFLVGRFISALGSSVGMKIAFTIIGDVFEGAKLTKVISLATLSFAIAPGIAVAVGGFLTDIFGWESCFYTLIIYSGLLAILLIRLPETAPQLDRDALNMSKIGEGFKRKFKNLKLIYASLLLGAVTSIIYLFATVAPFLAIEQLKIDPSLYGLLNCIPPLGLLAGSFASHLLSSKREKLDVIRFGTFSTLSVALIALGFFLFGSFNIATLFFPIPFLYFGTSLIFNNSSSIALEHVQDKSTGSAVMGFINMAFATLVVLFAGMVHTPVAMASTLVVLAALSCLLQYKLRMSL